MLADGLLVAGLAEITGKRLLADDVLSGLHRRDDHFGVEGGRSANIDDVDLRIGKEQPVVAMGLRDAMFPGELLDMIAARHNGRDLDIDPIDPLVGIHVQLGEEAAADQANAYFRHRNAPRMRAEEFSPMILTAPGGARGVSRRRIRGTTGSHPAEKPAVGPASSALTRVQIH
jgi:hypothetical protein